MLCLKDEYAWYVPIAFYEYDDATFVMNVMTCLSSYAMRLNMKCLDEG